MTVREPTNQILYVKNRMELSRAERHSNDVGDRTHAG